METNWPHLYAARFVLQLLIVPVVHIAQRSFELPGLVAAASIHSGNHAGFRMSQDSGNSGFRQVGW